jgi:hypothetical protein
MRNHIGRLMLKATGATSQIDSIHARAICDEIGDRLRGMLPRQASPELTPRLEELMEHLTMLDDQSSPSIVPSLDDMTIGERTVAALAPAKKTAAPGIETDSGAISSR